MKKSTKKKVEKSVAEIEVSPLEAYAPMRLGCIEGPLLNQLEGVILYQGCDGEDVYVWYVRPNKTGSKLKVTEVVPGLDKRKTRLRSVSTQEELSFTTGKTLDQIVAKWTESLIGDLEPELLPVPGMAAQDGDRRGHRVPVRALHDTEITRSAASSERDTRDFDDAFTDW